MSVVLGSEKRLRVVRESGSAGALRSRQGGPDGIRSPQAPQNFCDEVRGSPQEGQEAALPGTGMVG